MSAAFIWLDLETTGLDPGSRQILAIGMVVTDEKLTELGRFERYVRPGDLQCWDPIAQKMHVESGVLSKCLASDRDFYAPAGKRNSS
jgi:oligoribonuclease (3'-5' exoribonuclease)